MNRRRRKCIGKNITGNFGTMKLVAKGGSRIQVPYLLELELNKEKADLLNNEYSADQYPHSCNLVLPRGLRRIPRKI